ncbi:hypothetical protein SAMN06269185_1610 [Natronoarchaeum philippinense]|uniref:Uncharacterized protein n=1 Tax=Natronoarchaeum philippinense TaxID=558529 RepID=A0A285NSY8_NATPI|nr:rod-determining factor RdfA [Natronoarchaeum philippinense]SNZ12318.1 hypothetical protein SAMN06269185_1610 [Natronoarchaeum philippinense]
MTCKVDRVRDEYDLYNLDERLCHRYETGDVGVRRLETWINQQLLRRAMERAGMTVLDGEEENYHRLLTDDEVMDSAQDKAKLELRDAGVDVEQVTSDFVSYRTVLKHLKSCLNADTSRDYSPDPERDLQQIKKMRTRFANVIEGSLERLAREGEVEIDEPSASVQLKVRCGNCNRRHDVLDLLADSLTCPCQDEENADTGDGVEAMFRS